MTYAANSGSQRENKEKPRFHPLSLGADFVAASFAVFAIYVAGFGIFDTIIVYGTTVCLGAVWTFLSLASRNQGTFSPMKWLNIVLGIAFAALILRWMSIMLVQEQFFVDISQNDFVLAWAAFALIVYLTQRSFGWPMVTVLLALILYAVLPFGFGPRLDWSSVADRQWFTTDGVFGRPVQVVTTVVLIFRRFRSGDVEFRSGSRPAENRVRADRAHRWRTGARCHRGIRDVRHHVGRGRRELSCPRECSRFRSSSAPASGRNLPERSKPRLRPADRSCRPSWASSRS